jgi:hypothetical protein
LHSVFDGDPIANDDVVLDEYVRTYVAVPTDLSSGQYNHELPDLSAFADLS